MNQKRNYAKGKKNTKKLKRKTIREYRNLETATVSRL